MAIHLGNLGALLLAQITRYSSQTGTKAAYMFFVTTDAMTAPLGVIIPFFGESLKLPAGIAVDANSNLVVADRGSHCLWVVKADGSIHMRIGTKGHGPGELLLPYGVAIHQNGSIIVSESGNHRISIFSACGKFLQHFGQKGTEPGMFHYPRHVCVTSNGEIVVADEQNQRLQQFKCI